VPKPKTRLPRTKTRTQTKGDAPVKRTTTAKPPARRATAKSSGRASWTKRFALFRWWRETRGELAKVVWPTWTEVRYLTIAVLITTFLSSAFFGFVDWLFLQIVGFLIGV